MSKLEKARESLEALDALIVSLKSPKSVHAFRLDWEMSLVHLERVWSRVEAAYGRSGRWGGFSGPFQRARKDDQLLAYLRMARDSAEHGISEITNTVPGSMALNPVDPSKPMYIRNLQISEGRISVSSSENTQLEITPPHVELVAVSNRGVVKNVPTKHLGLSLDDVTMVEALAMARTYYASLIEKAGAFFEST